MLYYIRLEYQKLTQSVYTRGSQTVVRGPKVGRDYIFSGSHYIAIKMVNTIATLVFSYYDLCLGKWNSELIF